jgi:hypothetical protein
MRPWLVILAASVAANAATGPTEYVTKATSGRYSIIQRYVEPESTQDNQDGTWDAVLRFHDASQSDATLATGPEQYLWPGDYRISPDERWILRLQKTGSGENCALLYRVEANGQVWRLEQHLDELAFAIVTRGSHLSRSNYYHVLVDLVSWDMQSGLLHMKIMGTPEDTANPQIDHSVTYDFRKHTMVAK